MAGEAAVAKVQVEPMDPVGRRHWWAATVMALGGTETVAAAAKKKPSSFSLQAFLLEVVPSSSSFVAR